jgi:HPt (histidine-containing phosphotransfer) domain-containing protein
VGNLEKTVNPKDVVGSTKLPLHLWPSTATALGCLGMLDGALKYGRNNFREAEITASTYIDATARHLNAWMEGEEVDPDSGVPHLAHALATIAIIVDARVAGRLNDDRNMKLENEYYRRWIDNLTTHVSRLKEKHKSKSPRHYTIKDTRT